MSSTKTIGIIGGGQLGQMMAISAIYMGHKVITLDPASDCPSSRVSEVIAAPYDDVDALRQLAAAVMFSLMNLRMSTLTVLTLSSRMDNFHKEQNYFAFHKTVSLRRTSFQTRLK